LNTGDWTFIGNPFDFEIPLTNVYNSDSVDLTLDSNFYTYDGDWVVPSSLKPWHGYIYKSATADKLYLNPRRSNGGSLAKQIVDKDLKPLEEGEWLVNISARNGFAEDAHNTVGLLTTASDQYDDQDYFEPPMVPGGVALRIDDRHWEVGGDLYRRDIRTVKAEGEYWDLEVIAQDRDHNVLLTFDGIESIPEEFDVFLIDVTIGLAQDLRWKSGYRYAVADPEAVHRLRFIAGTREFLKKNSVGVELYPDRYSLSQNFPNPFNPRTSILLTLEEPARVDLVVYNILGAEVAVLARDDYRPAGYHTFIWKGLNQQGERVATGVYFYRARITSPSGKVILNQARKMVLVK